MTKRKYIDIDIYLIYLSSRYYRLEYIYVLMDISELLKWVS